MARARNIKPSFFKNEDLAELGMSTRLMFIGLWCLADRAGRLEDRPKRIKMELFPGDDVNVEKGLSELHASRFIVRYVVDGIRYIEIPTFEKHQHPHFKEAPSTIPKPQASTPLEPPLNPGFDAVATIPKPEASPGRAPTKESASPSDCLIPDSLIPDSLIPEKDNTLPAAPGGAPATGKTVETWNAYSRAYQERYGVEPLRNRKVNGQMATLVDQVGIEESPRVAEFYLTHNGGLYVSSGHCVDLLVRDCSKLRTEMLTGRKITRLEARNAEHGDALRAQVERVGRILEAQR